MTAPICDYCGHPAERVDGSTIYPHRRDLAHKLFWRCVKDDAWVGCHPGTDTPLGRLANAELRLAKRRAHEAFDPLWDNTGSKNKKGKSRSAAYAKLAAALGIPLAECHIGLFDVVTCRRAVDACARIRSGRC